MENKTITQDEVQILKTLMEGREKITILDIGAADLSHSVQFRNVFPDARIYAVEPDINYQAQNLHFSRMFQIEYSPCLLSGQEGEVRFYPSTTYEGYTGNKSLWAGSGSIYKPNKEFIDKNYPTLEFDTEGYEVCSYTFDGFCRSRNIDKIDYLHIDAQGAEYEILKDATILPDYIFAEISDFETYHSNTNRENWEYMLYQKGYVLIAEDEANALYLKATKIF